jgi:hypothetical protein
MLTLVPSPECRAAFGRTAPGSPDAPFIRIRASGRLSRSDYGRFEPEFAAELKRRQIPALPLLLDIARGHLRFRGFQELQNIRRPA